MYWWLAAGSDYTGGTNNTWSSNTNHLATTNQVNWLDSTSNDWFITGIQFEIGDQATDFEHLPIDIQLQRCRRYLQRIDASGTDYGTFGSGANANATSCQFGKQFSPVMRSVPTLITTGTAAN